MPRDSPENAKRRIFGYSFFSPLARLTTITLDWIGRRWRFSRSAAAWVG